MKSKIKVSTLGKTWILDLDGTILKHNGYYLDGEDCLLPNAIEFLNGISQKDMIIFLTSRSKKYKNQTEDFLKKNKIRYHQIIYEVPYGERILINDKKPSGLSTAIAINTERDIFLSDIFFEEDINL